MLQVCISAGWSPWNSSSDYFKFFIKSEQVTFIWNEEVEGIALYLREERKEGSSQIGE